MLRPIKKPLIRNEQADEAAYLAQLAAQRNASAFFEKYERSELQELLTSSFCSWLAAKDDLRHPLETPSGLMAQIKSMSTPTVILLTPVEPGIDLDAKEIHQIVRELAVGVYCLNQIPSISLDANYDQSISCSLPPAYYDTRIGQMLINVDYMLKALWHGAFMPKEKRVRFSELWRASMDIDADGTPQTEKTACAEFCSAGLTDISRDPDFKGIYDENLNEDPTYHPNSAEEKAFFMQFADYILLKLVFATTEVQQNDNVFKFEAAYTLSNAIRMSDDRLNTDGYMRLQQRLALQQKLIKKYLERKVEIRKNIIYLKLMSFLVPFMAALKRKNKIPNLNRLLQPYSDDKVKTERELPPILLGPDFKCQHFTYAHNRYFHLHGGIEFDIGTPSVEEIPNEIKAAYDDMYSCATNYITQLLDPDAPYREHYPVPVMDFDGKSYYVISLELEPFYLLLKTQWWGAINELIITLKPKRLPLTDNQAMELFKKKFGYKKAIKCKSLPFGMKSAAERGLAAIFLTFCRKTAVSSLGLTDDHGFALIHHAAIHNHVSIISQLVKSTLTINQRRHVPYSQDMTDDQRIKYFLDGSNQDFSELVVKFLLDIIGKRFQKGETKGFKPVSGMVNFLEKDGERSFLGPTALHFAAQSCSLEALHFLLALKADYRQPDNRGWMPVHFAAYYDNIGCFTILYRKNPDLLEAETRAEYQSTPLLLAATSGALDTIQYLFSLNVNWLKKDNEGNNLIHLAVLNFHTEVLKHLIELNFTDLPVWTTLVGMLDCDNYKRKEMAIRCLEVLCLAKDDYWKFILDAGTIPSLINMLKTQAIKLECFTVGVLSNITTHNPVAKAFVEGGGIAVLIKLLASDEPELLSRCAVILYDIAQLDDNQTVIAELGALPALVNLLNYDIENLLVNVMNCIRVLCTNHKANQLEVKDCMGIDPLVQFLSSDSDVLLAVASATIAELARGNKKMQNGIVEAHVIGPLVELLRGRKISVQVKGAMAIQTLCEKNAYIQMRFLARSVTKFLLKLLKAFQLKVKEQGAVTLWALAGQTLKQQKYMAEQIGYNLIIDMLLSPSDKMQCVGGEAVIALSKDSQTHQNEICKGNGIAPLVRLLRSSKIAEGTLLSIIRALGTICVGEAIISNPVSQENVVEEGALPILVNLLKTHHSLQIKVETAVSLACIVLKNSRLQIVLQNQEGFSYTEVLHLLYTTEKAIRLRAGFAVTLFAYNNPAQQLLILETGPISLSIFEPLLESELETEKAMAAFQIIVLARIIVDKDQVSLSARGVSILVDLLCSEEAATLVLTGKLLASLAHTRAGIPEAITSLGTVQRLCYHLYAKEEEVLQFIDSQPFVPFISPVSIQEPVCFTIAVFGFVRIAMACALGYLTYNRMAYRHLLVQCRNKPKLFKRLIKNLSRDARINSEFVKEFKRQKKVGLPSLSLEINGGPPAVPVHTRAKSMDGGNKLYKSKFRPKDSLFLVPTTTHLMGRFRTPEKPRLAAMGHYPVAHSTPSDLIQVSRPRIVDICALRSNTSGKKP